MVHRFSLFHTYSGLDRSIYVLFAARIVNRMGDFVQLFLVLYLTSVIGLSGSEAGRFIMLAGLMNGAGILVGGWAADRFNRKYVLVGCQLFFAASFAVSGFYTSTMTAPWLIFFSSLFRGATWPVTNAMVTDLTDGEDRTKAFSLLYVGTNIGVAVGPLIAGILFESHLPWIFWGDSLTTLFAAGAVTFFVKETKPTSEKIAASILGSEAGERAVKGGALVNFFGRPVLVGYLVLTVFSGFVYAQHAFSLPLQLSEIFAASGARYYGYLMAVNAVTVLLLSAGLVHLTKGYRPAANLAFASLLYAIGFGMILWLTSLPMILFSTAVWTVGEILMVTHSNVFTAKHTPITHRGRFYGIITFVYGIGNVTCPWISGIMVEHFGLRSIWPAAGTVGLISAAGFGVMWFFIKKQEERIRDAAVQQGS